MALEGGADSVEKGNPDDHLLLYGFGSLNETTSSFSPYVAKVETFLRMNGIAYQVEAVKGNLERSPKKTVRRRVSPDGSVQDRHDAFSWGCGGLPTSILLERRYMAL